MLSNYRKLIVAVVGAILVALNTFFGIDIAMGADGVMNILIPILTAFGVWAAPNTEKSNA